MESASLQVDSMKKMLMEEGVLDEHFVELENLFGDIKSFEEFITGSFEESARNIRNIEQLMEKSPIDFIGVGRALHKLKGTSASMGAKIVFINVNEMTDHCKDNNLDGCKASLQGLKRGYNLLKEKLTIYFQESMKIAGGADQLSGNPMVI